MKQKSASRILILNHNQQFFGTYYRCLNFARYLSDTGHTVDLICASPKKFDPWIRFKKVRHNLRIITLPRLKYGRYLSGQLVRLIISIFFVLSGGYSVLYAFTVAQPQIAWPAIIFKKITQRKLLIDWDDLWGGGFAEAHNSVFSALLSWHETNFLNYADGITYVSHNLGARISQYANANVPRVKIENGCDPANFKEISKSKARALLSIPIDTKLVVSVGNTYTDGLLDLIDAMGYLEREDFDLTLIMVGIDGRDLSGFLSGRQKPSNIRCVGKKSFEVAQAYMYASDCLALPMGNNEIEKCRFPMRFADYLAVGRPIVSNAVGDVEYFIKKYQAGFLSVNGDSRGYANNIRRAIDSHIESQAISENQKLLARTRLRNTHLLKKLEQFI